MSVNASYPRSQYTVYLRLDSSLTTWPIDSEWVATARLTALIMQYPTAKIIEHSPKIGLDDGLPRWVVTVEMKETP
jgi:hypothetical protein